MLKQFRRFHSTAKKFPLQYISDLHIDVKGAIMPKITPVSPYLGICGDIGNPTHANFGLFLTEMSKQFKKVFFVPGNHDFDCGSIYQKEKVNLYEPIIKNICRSLGNVYYMNRDFYHLTEKTIVLGATLWSRPTADNVEYSGDSETYSSHVVEHRNHLKWIEQTIKQNNNKKIIVLTHFLPTFKLIEKKYQQRGLKVTSRYATDLEYMIKDPITAWLCGHSHSVIECQINGIYCGLNATGYPSEKSQITQQIKTIEFE